MGELSIQFQGWGGSSIARDIEDAWLPTVDSTLRVNLNDIIEHIFFEKHTNPNTVLSRGK